MKNILVSGASGVLGYGVLKSLRVMERPVRLIGTSIYDDSIADVFCDVFVQAPLTKDDGYLDWLNKVITDYDIDLAIPCIEDDVYTWSDNRDLFDAAGTKAVLNCPSLLSLCRDKWLFYNELDVNDSNYVIETIMSRDFDEIVSRFGLPFLLKPRVGYASRGIVKVNDREDFLPHADSIGDNLMVQPYVGDDNEEYTTSAFCDGKGGFTAYMSLRRKLAREGFTEKAEVADPDGIEDALRYFCKQFKPIGPTNFQFRMHDGVLKLLEINPRISSATSMRMAFGFNESAMAVDYYLDGVVPTQPPIKPGRAVRYLEDYIYAYEDRADL